MHTLTILPRESYLRHRWNKNGKCERCGFDGATFMLWMQSDKAKMYPEAGFPKCKGEMMTNFETLQLDSPEIPDLCRQKYRELIGRWPEPGEMDDRAAVWAMAWLSKPDAVPSDDGWIEWGGGECPVLGKRVEYRMRDGDYDERLADFLRWDHGGWDGDIVAYRIVKEGRHV